MFRKTLKIPRSGASATALKPGLPDERKALVERYMIDTEDAELRAQRAAEEQARREAAEAETRAAREGARRAAEEHARRETEERARREAEEQARREAEEQARREAVEAETRRRAEEEQARIETARREAESDRRADDEAQPSTDEFPIYVWLQRAAPEPDATDDWPRSLLETKEEARRAANQTD